MPRLTKEFVKALRPDPAGRERFLWDTTKGAPVGFGIRIKPSGAASYIVQYRNQEGRTRRMAIGRVGDFEHPDRARGIARDRLGDVRKGGDPSAQRNAARKAMTVRELCALYLDAAGKGLPFGKRGQAKQASTLATDRGRIERHIVPLLGRRKVKDLAPPDVARFIADVLAGKTAADVKTGRHGRAIVTGGAGTAARTVGLLSGILAYAVTMGVIAANPAHGVKRPGGGKRRVILSDDEYRALGDALRAVERGGAIRAGVAAVRLLALTGCRRGEVVGLRWGEVDLDRRCLRLTDSKEGESTRPLGAAAADVLRALPRQGEFVIASPRDADRAYTAFKKFFVAVAARAGLPTLTPHGLRHAFASVAADLGFVDATIGAMLGHRSRSMTGRYTHSFDSTTLAAADRVSKRIADALDGRTGAAEVVQIGDAPRKRRRG